MGCVARNLSLDSELVDAGDRGAGKTALPTGKIGGIGLEFEKNHMVIYKAATRELSAKIVYYGPGLGGKTTNLQLLHERLEPATVQAAETVGWASDAIPGGLDPGTRCNRCHERLENISKEA